MQPLAGLRVVDLADEKGELCGRVLADYGAEVIRVEPPGGAVSRRLAPLASDGETSLYFAVRNAGKRGVELDIETEAGRERLHGLLAEADVLIESTMPAHQDPGSALHLDDGRTQHVVGPDRHREAGASEDVGRRAEVACGHDDDR